MTFGFFFLLFLSVPLDGNKVKKNDQRTMKKEMNNESMNNFSVDRFFCYYYPQQDRKTIYISQTFTHRGQEKA